MGTVSDIMKPVDRACFDSEDFETCMDAICAEIKGPEHFFVDEGHYALSNPPAFTRIYDLRAHYARVKFAPGVGPTFNQKNFNNFMLDAVLAIAQVREACTPGNTQPEGQTEDVHETSPEFDPDPSPDYTPAARATADTVFDPILGYLAMAAGTTIAALKAHFAAKSAATVQGGSLLHTLKPVTPSGGGFFPMLLIIIMPPEEYFNSDSGPIGPSA